MRPSATDIAPPPFAPGTEWIGGEQSIDRLAARGPVLVHFFDLAQLNSVRSLDYVRAWAARYRDAGLALVGIHSPRFPFTRPARVVAAAVEALAIHYPVAIDAEFRIWRDYGCQGWPSLFLWGRGGVLRWYHRGEGEYAETERAIQTELAAGGEARRFPPPLEPLRASDAPGAMVVPPTAELHPGGGIETPWRDDGDGDELTIAYEAAGAYASVSGRGEIRVELDGSAARTVGVAGPGLVELSAHEHHERHQLALRASAGVEIWSLDFAAGTA